MFAFRISEQKGYRKVSTYTSSARFRFGEGSAGEVRHAADIPVVIAGSRGKFPAFMADADFAALLRTGAVELLGRQLEFSRDMLTLRRHGEGTTL